MPDGITQCYLPPGRGDTLALTPSRSWYSIKRPQRDARLSERTRRADYCIVMGASVILSVYLSARISPETKFPVHVIHDELDSPLAALGTLINCVLPV